MVSEAKLMLLLGGVNIGYKFPTEGEGKSKRKLQVSLQTILNHKDKDRYGNQLQDSIASVKSFDPRFDKKHPVQLAVDDICQNGIRDSILAKIYVDDSCIRVGKLVGKYALFNDLLSDQQKAVVEQRLQQEVLARVERRKNLEGWCK